MKSKADDRMVGTDSPGVVARPPRIAYLFLACGAVLEAFWHLPSCR